MREVLRVGVHRLPPGEAGLVRGLVTLWSRSGDRFRWTFAGEAPFDALVVQGGAAGEAACPAARAVAVLGEPPAGTWADAEILPRPLQAERLERWLTRLQGRLVTGIGGAVQADLEAAPAVARDQLRRWPPAALLRGQPQRVRLATLLARRPLAPAELARLARESPQRCEAFMQLLQDFALLRRVPPAVPRAEPRPEPAAPPPVATRALIQAIRRRLGLGG
ncbi:MAG TPA: hypothetical protein VEA40_02315 [Ramlibacter sp.]|nr:hypothetical protein [Ramlibacter sp.]